MSLRNLKFENGLKDSLIKKNVKSSEREFSGDDTSKKRENSVKNCYMNFLQKSFYSSMLYILHAVFISIRAITVFIARIKYSIFIKYKINKKMLQDLVNKEFSKKLTAPSEVCIILNENDLQDENALPKFNVLINTLSSLGTKSITFYQFKDIHSSIKENYQEKDSNNNISKDKPTLNFLSHKQIGKDLLVQTCKNLSQLLKAKKIKFDDINKNLIDGELYEISKLKEPELIISIGSCGAISGFSPWHIRLSEIINIPDFKLINEIYIINILSKYNKIERRLGK